MTKGEISMDLTALGAAIAAFTGIGAGIGIGIATAKAVDAVARQPEASSKIMTLLILGGALAEATAIYGMIVALLIIFA
jgi:F-type H+-transporting ATPase subunit c